MSKIANDGLTRSGTQCFIAVPNTHTATVGVKGLIHYHYTLQVKPSPVKPRLHWHSYDPAVLIHTASSQHPPLSVLHSLMSTDNVTKQTSNL